MLFTIGIDPQPSLIAVHIYDILRDRTIKWFVLMLQKKTRKNTAQEWQEYICKQSDVLLNYCIDTIISYNGGNCLKHILVVVEQQRGRVNSIIEQSILASCVKNDVARQILHPLTWKKKVGINCMGSNKENKKLVENLVSPILKKYCKETGMNICSTCRIHDMCDAYLISKAFSNEQIGNKRVQ